MGGRHLIINIFEALDKLRRDALLVAQSQIFQVERLGMTSLGAHASPFGVDVTIGPLNQVEGLIHPLVHLVHRHPVLRLVFHAPATVGALATHTTGKDRQRFHAHILTELEILKVSQSH